MRTHLLHVTPQAKQMLVFSKRTRHMTDVSAYEEVLRMPEDELDGNIQYVFNTIGSSWEFIHYTFLIEGVTRAFTHQLVRHRVGTAFAQQAQRVANMGDFKYLTTGSIIGDEEKERVYDMTMQHIQTGYMTMIDMGANVQDARGVLPTNILTNILFKVNLRAISDMMHVRLCIRAQGEFQNVARSMRDEICREHPWVSPLFGPKCIIMGRCAFPAYESCPISQRFPSLRALPEQMIKDMRQLHEGISGFDPQPGIHDWSKEG